MTLAAEWNSYSIHRKSLCVSTFLCGHQRSIYFISLPYRYALSPISFSGVLHWFMSQSLYVVVIRGHGVNHERDPSLDPVTCAYSPVGIVSSVSVGAFMLVCLVLIGCQRFKSKCRLLEVAVWLLLLHVTLHTCKRMTMTMIQKN